MEYTAKLRSTNVNRNNKNNELNHLETALLSNIDLDDTQHDNLQNNSTQVSMSRLQIYIKLFLLKK